MPNFSTKLKELNTMERLSSGDSLIHRLHPVSKLVVTFLFVASVISLDRYAFWCVLPYFAYIFVCASLADVSYSLLFRRSALALPFCLFAGVSNVIFEQSTAFFVGGLGVSYGFLSLVTILLKTLLSTSAVILLSATTPVSQTAGALIRLKVPGVLVTQLFMTYRYLCIIANEAHSMYNAYMLRSGGKRAISIMHTGSFLGQLLIRSFKRAERVTLAMKCRGYSGETSADYPKHFKKSDILYTLTLCTIIILIRVWAFYVKG